jgi:anaerobic dimethyl sulfoxide reductase subunit C
MTRRFEMAAREWSLVAFTMLAQAAAGVLALVVLPWALAGGGPARRPEILVPCAIVLGLLAVAAALSLLHLGKPANAPRTLANLRTSWLSREIFFLGLSAGTTAILVAQEWARTGGKTLFAALAAAAALAGAALVLSMANIYRLEAVPVWRSGLTPFSFFMTAALAGTLAVAAWPARLGPHPMARWAGLFAMGLLVLDLAVTAFADPTFGLPRLTGCLEDRTVPRRLILLFGLRLAFLLAAAAAAATVLLMRGASALLMTPPLAAALVSELLGRVLFYAKFKKAGL